MAAFASSDRRKANSIDPESAMKGKDIPKLVEEDMSFTLQSMIYYHIFVPAVNDYVGEKYFDSSTSTEPQPTGELVNSYSSLSAEERDGQRGLDLLLQMLERNPFDQDVYNDLITTHSKPGCGLSAFIEQINPGKNIAGEIKWKRMKEWFEDESLSSHAIADKTIAAFHEICERSETTRRDAAPAYDLVTLTECTYTLYDTAYDLMLNRYVWAQTPNPANHPALIKTVEEVRARLCGGSFVPACQPYIDSLLSACLPLLELIDDDGRTVHGNRFATYEEAQAFFADTFDVSKPFYDMDFLAPDSVSHIDRLVDEHRYRDLLLPYKEKARSAAALAVQIRDFLAEVSGREYPNRPQLIYDLMIANSLETRRKILWLQGGELERWYTSHRDDALQVFGQSFYDMDDANAYYYDVMEKAWLYQEYLDIRNDKQAGLLKKMGNSLSGQKKQCEPEYMLATDNGTRPLIPLTPDERKTVGSHWQYAKDEDDRIYEEHCSRYDPAAIEGKKRMNEVRKKLVAIAEDGALDTIKTEVLNAPWQITRPAAGRPPALAAESPEELTLGAIIKEYPADYDFAAAALAKEPVRKDSGIRIVFQSPTCKARNKFSFQITGITPLMEKESAFASIYKVDAAHNDYGDYCYLYQSQTEYTLKAPWRSGKYEVRVYSNFNAYNDETLVESASVQVV
jgi:hypothetical protein